LLCKGSQCQRFVKAIPCQVTNFAIHQVPYLKRKDTYLQLTKKYSSCNTWEWSRPSHH
jgi:hypothetical protein